MEPVLRSLDHLARRILPFLTVALTLVLDLLPMTTLASDAVRPSFAIVAVYFWVFYRPDLLGPVTLFALGIVADAIAAVPIGMTSLQLLALRAFVTGSQQTLLSRSFLGCWLGLGIITFSLSILRWLLACLYAVHVFPIDTVLVSALLTVLCYPPIALLLGRAKLEVDESRHEAGN